jgi:hypothetical protein
MKYPKLDMETMEAVINKLGGMEDMQRFLRDELIVSKQKPPEINIPVDYTVLGQFVSPDGKVSLEDFKKCMIRWREESGVIYFGVVSNGKTGVQWIEYFESKGVKLTKWAKDVLLSEDFKPTDGVTYEIAVLSGKLWSDSDRITKRIRKDAHEGTFTSGNKLFDPNVEIACLIRDMFPDEEIEAIGPWWIVAMHEPIEDSAGAPSLLLATRGGGGQWLDAAYDGPDGGWSDSGGFAFALSQVSTPDSETQA